jgi:uncharacterized delta-60 repeat protein
LVGLVLVAVVALVSATPAGAATGQAGTLDRSFAGGSVIRGFGTVPGEGGAAETVPMPDGGFLVRTARGSIGRYLVDGSRDRAFGEDGYLIGATAWNIAVTADGRIYVLGSGKGEGARLSRLLPDSSPDPSFGRDGSVELGRMAPVEDMLVAPGGAVFLVGTEFKGDGGAGVNAIRVRPDGRVDAAYGHRGVARIYFPRGSGDHFLFALDGERLAFVDGAGSFSKGSASWRNILLGRIDPGGVVEPSFPGLIKLPGGVLEGSLTGIASGPGDGVTVIAGADFVHLSADGALEPGGPSDEAALRELTSRRAFSSFAIQPDGKVVIGGRTVNDGPNRLVLARLDPDGFLDPAFGGDGSGIVTTGMEVGEGTPLLSVLADGGILLSGETGAHPPLLAATRFTADGVLDPGFGSGGALVVPPVVYSDDKVNAVTAVPGGGVLATGTAGGRVLVAKYKADGRPEPAFADHGFFRTDPAAGAGPEQGTSLARLPDGRILVGTRSPSGASLIMLGAGGQPVRSFGSAGTVAVGDLDEVSAMAMSRSGTILVAGSSREPCHFLVERLGPGGGVDRGFGTAAGATQIGRECRGSNAVDLVQRPDGNLVVAIEGTRTIRELTADGQRSTRFSVGNEDSWRLPRHLGAIALDARGRLIVGGTLHHRLGLVRLGRDGELERGFGRDGGATREVGREAKVTGLAIEPNGRILASGTADVCPPRLCLGATALVARFGPGGAADPEFGRRGVWTGRREGSAFDSLALAGEGTLFAGGWATLRSDRNLLLVKVRR